MLTLIAASLMHRPLIWSVKPDAPDVAILRVTVSYPNEIDGKINFVGPVAVWRYPYSFLVKVFDQDGKRVDNPSQLRKDLEVPGPTEFHWTVLNRGDSLTFEVYALDGRDWLRLNGRKLRYEITQTLHQGLDKFQQRMQATYPKIDRVYFQGVLRGDFEARNKELGDSRPN